MRILNVEPEGYSPAARAILDSFARVEERSLSTAELKKRLPDYDVLIVRLGHRIDRSLLSGASRLRIVVAATTGLDHIDVEAANERGVEVLSLHGEHEFLDTIRATAEHTWAMLLALVRRVPAATASVLEGQWNRDAFVGSELNGRTLGIVGYGRLGQMVGRFGQAFGMAVCASDPDPRVPDAGVVLLPLDQLLERADVVSLHVPLSDETRGLVGSLELSTMKRGAWLINTSRGGILDERALLEALESRQLGGASLDVLVNEDSRSQEWMRGHPLIAYASRHDNLLVTPHIGGATHESMQATEVFLAKTLRDRARQLGL